MIIVAFPLFLIALFVFHTSEFLLALIYQRNELSFKSFLLSQPYCIAMSVACVEYAVEKTAVPKLKSTGWISCLGLAAIITGEVVRKIAMITAGHNFTHNMKNERREEHVLVRHGIYRYMRHPGYFGWLLWALGTQLLLVNPICFLAFSYVIWHFFKERIEVEEEHLRTFFGKEYEEYAAVVPTRIPYIP